MTAAPESIDEILRENAARRKRAILFFVLTVALVMVVVIPLVTWISGRTERECRAKGGEIQCTTTTGILNGQAAVLESCSCVIPKDGHR